MTRPAALVVHAFGWTWRWDTYGVSLFDTARFTADTEAAEQAAAEAELAAEHDCRRDHPDGPCDEDDEVGSFSDTDFEELLWRARNGDDPTTLMAEFYAGIRADPERP